MSGIPSDNLVGLKLRDGWEVVEKIYKRPTVTGGRFSCGYKVVQGEKIAYLKALDFSEIFNSSTIDIPKRLQELTSAYNFERDLLTKCKDRHLSKVIRAIADGDVSVQGFPDGINKVFYIIFDFAEGDIRKIKDTFKEIDLAFIFRALHNTAVGIQQLHTNGIAHQDIKPSNVLSFDKDYKISDLGRASDREQRFVNDDFNIPGDRTYAPIEQLYNYKATNEFNDRYSADMYLFGSLFFFFFTGLSATASIINKSQTMKISYTNNFESDIAEWQRAFTEVVVDFKITLQKFNMKEEVVEEVVNMVRYLCNPDPRKRGYPENINVNKYQYSLERFISRLDYLAKKAEFELI